MSDTHLVPYQYELLRLVLLAETCVESLLNLTDWESTDYWSSDRAHGQGKSYSYYRVLRRREPRN